MGGHASGLPEGDICVSEKWYLIGGVSRNRSSQLHFGAFGSYENFWFTKRKEEKTHQKLPLIQKAGLAQKKGENFDFLKLTRISRLCYRHLKKIVENSSSHYSGI